MQTLRPRTKLSRQAIGLPLALVSFALPFVVTFEGLSEEGHRVLGIFLAAIVLWVTEAIPLHATAALIILAEILLISDKALVSVSSSAPAYSEFFATLAHPVLMLFLGGFVLADGAAKYDLDRNLAGVLLRPFGNRPRNILAGLMLIAAGFSMFMSNTATTATLMAVVIPVLARLPEGDRMKAGIALSIPVAANIGGIGTPVGTPPNAIAVGSLAEAGINISFVRWMGLAVPVMLILLAIAWYLFIRLFPTSVNSLVIELGGRFDRSPAAILFYSVFALTVGLWLTEPFHGIPSAIVGFFPVVILLATGVFTTRDMQSIQWHVLWLVAGGIALGAGVATTGLDVWMVEQINWSSFSTIVVLVVLALLTLTLSTVISNSATANLLIAIGLSMAASPAIGLSAARIGFVIAVAASLAMALPISTPPNAVAYSTGVVTTRDMAIVGSIIGVIGLVLYLGLAPILWTLMGVTP